jgi:hypothetical protein
MVFPAKLMDGILNTPQPNCFTIRQLNETDNPSSIVYLIAEAIAGSTVF